MLESGKAGSESSAKLSREPAARGLERASRIFRALGDPERLRLLLLLSEGECCVTAAAEAQGEDISTVSQRLRVLRNEGLVSRRRDGKQIVYALADQHVADLMFTALAHASEPWPPARDSD
jgi:ArsR family transcriptional regulator, lead/cadmium/zinc/bismuth-responsive transcriptional repressor